MQVKGQAGNLFGFPAELPVFPLSGSLLLPRGQLPLHIFEDRFKAMLNDVLGNSRLIGMVQPRDPGITCGDEHTALFTTGCAGKITSFSETEDGRFLITLTGLCRFNIAAEAPTRNGYRVIRPDWDPYAGDLQPDENLCLERDRLKNLLKTYFEMHDLSCDWEMIDEAPDEKLITCLSMICPLDPGEKQALLEAGNCAERARLFMAMLDMAVRCGGSDYGCH